MSIKKYISLIESVASGSTEEFMLENQNIDTSLKNHTPEELANLMIANAKERADMVHKRSGVDDIDHVGEYRTNIRGVGNITVKAIKVPTLNKDGTVKKYQYRITIKIYRQQVPKKELIRRFEQAKGE